MSAIDFNATAVSGVQLLIAVSRSKPESFKRNVCAVGAINSVRRQGHVFAH